MNPYRTPAPPPPRSEPTFEQVLAQVRAAFEYLRTHRPGPVKLITEGGRSYLDESPWIPIDPPRGSNAGTS